MNDVVAPAASVADQIGLWIGAFDVAELPQAATEMARRLVLDVVGLCVAGRREDYIAATLGPLTRGVPVPPSAMPAASVPLMPH